jgi:two-component system response regulator RegA
MEKVRQEGRRLLLVDDDENYTWAMQRAFEKRGYAVDSANNVTQALCLAETWQPDYALVDLCIPGASGLTLLSRLKIASPATRIVMLTGYASIATAVEATKLGAIYYLAKPADVDAVEAAFGRDAGDESMPAPEQFLSVDRLAWEHIHRVLASEAGNVSAAARTLGMHRRTLQRKLRKFAPR